MTVDMGEDGCSACGDTGYLMDQTYGAADIPDGWIPVQACDACELLPTDEIAACCAQNDRDDIDRRVHLAFFPGALDDNDEREPGDWAIGPNL